MSFGYIARSTEQRQHIALAHRQLHPYRLIITLGDSIAVVFSRPLLLPDYYFAPHKVRGAIVEWLAKPCPMIIDVRISRNVLTVPNRRLLYARDE
jgi:hypothetical protein